MFSGGGITSKWGGGVTLVPLTHPPLKQAASEQQEVSNNRQPWPFASDSEVFPSPYHDAD